MPTRRPHVTASAAQTELAAALAALRVSLELPGDFPADAAAEAVWAAAQLELPLHDLTAVEFVTIDPPTATDLDQALHIEALPGPVGGFRVRYAIADVPALVSPGGAVDREAGCAVRRSTPRMAGFRCIRLPSATVQARCCRMPCAAPTSGISASARTPQCSERSCSARGCALERG